MLIAQLTGEARHHARWRDLIEAEHAAAVAALHELAAGRADLLDEVVGILEGASEQVTDRQKVTKIPIHKLSLRKVIELYPYRKYLARFSGLR